jgi:predicted ATPase
MISASGQAVSPVIVGRESELNALGRALHTTQRDAGRCILIGGEVGIGKSRLVAELRTRATAERWTILEGHCCEQDISFPYARAHRRRIHRSDLRSLLQEAWQPR